MPRRAAGAVRAAGAGVGQPATIDARRAAVLEVGLQAGHRGSRTKFHGRGQRGPMHVRPQREAVRQLVTAAIAMRIARSQPGSTIGVERSGLKRSRPSGGCRNTGRPQNVTVGLSRPRSAVWAFLDRWPATIRARPRWVAGRGPGLGGAPRSAGAEHLFRLRDLTRRTRSLARHRLDAQNAHVVVLIQHGHEGRLRVRGGGCEGEA